MRVSIFPILILFSIASQAGEKEVKQVDDFIKVVEQVVQPGAMFQPPCRFTAEGSVLAPSKYLDCIERFPAELQTYLSPNCQSKGISAGTNCLVYEDTQFENALKAQDTIAYDRYMEAKTINDDGDSQACVRYVNGIWKRPSNAFLQRTKQLAEFIKSTAKYYGIPPEAIVCTIGGDATATSSFYPDQNYYANNMIQDGPIKTAKRDLKRLQLSFNRPPKPSKALGKMKKDEIKSIREAAMLLRHAAALYGEAGFVPSDLPAEVLTSIYHLGAYRGDPPVNMAQSTMQQNKKPRLSFLGLFCARYKDEILAALDSGNK